MWGDAGVKSADETSLFLWASLKLVPNDAYELRLHIDARIYS